MVTLYPACTLPAHTSTVLLQAKTRHRVDSERKEHGHVQVDNETDTDISEGEKDTLIDKD